MQSLPLSPPLLPLTTPPPSPCRQLVSLTPPHPAGHPFPPQEERIVVIVGHSLWHKAFLSRDGARGDREVKSMANGELRMLYK